MGERVASVDIVVRTTGEVVDSACDHVRRQISAVARRIPGQVSAARVKLTAVLRPSAPWSALVQANMEVDGRLIRVQVAAAFFREAAGVLRARLGEQVTRLTRPWVPRPWPESAHRPHRAQPVARPAGQREIVRHKAYPLARCRPDQAALTMDLMDYDIHLFTDADTGQDSVIYRVGPTGYRLARLGSMAPPSPLRAPLTVNAHPVPRLTADQAVERLSRTELPFQFFQDAATERGVVLYQRYDGHYGLVGGV